MSTSLTSTPLSSVDGRRMRANSDSSKLNDINISTTPMGVSHLSAYSTYPTYSNSASPSNFGTPAELTSENSVFSEYDYAGDDEFFGVNFDATGDQGIGADPLILNPTAELPTAEAYLTQAGANRAQSSETATSSTYPMSSNQSSPPSRHSPKSEALTAHHQELSKAVTARQGMMPYNVETTIDDTQQTLDQMGSGLTSADNVGLGVGNHMGHSPRLTLTSWEGMEPQELRTEPEPQDMQYVESQSPWEGGIQDQVSSEQQFTTGHNLESLHADNNHFGTGLNRQDAPELDVGSGRTGVEPGRRKSLSDAHIPNFKDQEEAIRLRQKNMEVEEWRSQASDSTDAGDDNPHQSGPTLSAPTSNTRRRARTTSAIPGYFPSGEMKDIPRIKKDPTEGEGIDPVSDSESVRENQIKDGQVYFNPKATGVTIRDEARMQESRQWTDGPAYPYVTETKTQAPTAAEAAKRWNEAADTYSVISRTATWGTRRRSEPSIVDMESINAPGFLKRLSFKTDKEFKSEREKRPNPLIDTLANMVRKKSDSSKLKRKTSTNDTRGRPEAGPFIKQESRGNLAPPPLGPIHSHRRGASSPRLNTNVGSSSFTGGSGSVSATASSPKATLGFNLGARIRRARSGSNLQSNPAKDGIYGMWKQTGGPPVAKLGATPFDSDPRPSELSESKGGDYSDADGEDDDEEELVDDGEMMDFDQNTPITPNLAGFQEHVIGLYPLIERTYLVDRIAHQQVVRYKGLLQCRVKHQGFIANQNCPAEHHCIALGGSPTLLEPKNQHRDSDASNAAVPGLADVSDGDSNPEGALAAESFPPGVPMPPAQSLPAEFECQLCFRVKKFLKPSDWTKHVHEDVQPFTCTYANCKEPKSFKRKADWVRHENERHRRLSWWTCTQDDCQHRCYRKDNFLQHLVREHKIPEPKQKTKAAAKKARNSDEAIWVLIRNCHHETTAKPQDEPCKFCGKVFNSWKKLTVHLAKHMELISLSVLRLVELQSVSADTIISPVEPLPVRQAPLTPVDRNDRRLSTGSMQYGNLSASISPHVNAMSQFSSPLYPQASPNIPDLPRFSGVMYAHNMGYIPTTTGQDMSSYDIQAPVPQNQPEYMYEDSGIYGHQMAPQMDNTRSRGFTMDHSPSLEQPSGFTTVNGPYTPVNQQQNFHSYSNSNSTLSPDPGFASGPQQMPGFQAQSLAPHQQAYATSPLHASAQQSFATSPHHGPAQQPFASSPHHAPSYPPPQMPSFADESIYNNQVLQQTQNGLAYDPMTMEIAGQSGVIYPPTSTGGYSYHQ